MPTQSNKERRKTPEQQSHDFAATQPARQQAYAQYCFAQGYAAGHRARIEEAATLQAVEEEALAQIADEAWRALMQQWLDYKKTIHKRYTLVSSIVGCYEELHQHSGGDIEVARQWMQRSINSGYIGIAIPNHGQQHTVQHPYPTAGNRAEQRKEEVRELSRMASASASAIAALGLGGETE